MRSMAQRTAGWELADELPSRRLGDIVVITAGQMSAGALAAWYMNEGSGKTMKVECEKCELVCSKRVAKS